MSIQNVTRGGTTQPSLFETSLQPATRQEATARAARATTGFDSTSAFTTTATATAAPAELGGGAQQVGPLSLQSPQAQVAIQKALAYLGNQKGGTLNTLARTADMSQSFSPRSVERDELGMTHVRMDRMHEGVRVFGEQVISHLDRNGEVRDMTGEMGEIPAGLGSGPVKLTGKQAVDIAQQAFQGPTDSDRPPSVERVVYQDKNGQYHAAFHVKLENVYELQAGDRPRRMNYLIDANTGEALTQYNQIGGACFCRSAHSCGKSDDVKPDKLSGPGSAATPPQPLAVEASTSPNLEIPDRNQVSTTLQVDQDVDIEKLAVNLDINHTYKGDLRITLTSPSGTSAVVFNRTGGSTDDVKGKFDLSAFNGEPSVGEWKLTVEDLAARDVGKLNSWGLSIEGTPRNPTPEPEPTPDPTPTPQPAGDDTSLYSGKVNLSTKQNPNGTYTLGDSTRGNGVVTYDGNNRQRGTGTTPFTDSNNVWGEATDNPRNRAAIDAHYGAQMTYDFYKDVLGRNSIDGRGEKLVSYVHIGNNYVNAFWDGEKMSYGDGDGRTAGPLTTLDIAGHEITHGLTERTAGLIYEGESGGLNEAFSDIMGTGVEWYASQKNSGVQFDWSLGEDAWTPNRAGDALRYMDDPTRDNYSIDNYKNYPKQTEVHGSSGIANNAFYLLVNGGTNRTSNVEVQDGIGMDKGLKIYYRALSNYMTPRTTFAQAREATLKAATDLYGADSVEVQKVKESWTAVGVG